MKFWQQISGKFKKPDTTGGQKAGKEPFLIKYRSFRELLSQNNAVLELMAEIEEKLSVVRLSAAII